MTCWPTLPSAGPVQAGVSEETWLQRLAVAGWKPLCDSGFRLFPNGTGLDRQSWASRGGPGRLGFTPATLPPGTSELR
jgi:hypothetical protein